MAANAIAMPRLGMTMEEGTVVAWPIAIGEKVAHGQVVLVIETEKAESEIESTVDGVFRHVYVEPGDTVPCGALLAAVTESADEPFEAVSFAEAYVPPDGPAPKPAAPVESTAPSASVDADTSAKPKGRTPVAPAARALARKLGIDPTTLVGTGPKGRVTRADVEAHAAIRERLVEVEPGIGLEVLREGAGDAVVLLPGFGTDVSSFALQTPALSEHFEVIGVNPRGVGASEAPDLRSYPVERAADDVAAVLDGPAHVVGASLGAAVAMELALRHPERVRSLTLVTPFVDATPRLLAFARAWRRAREEASPEAVAEILAPWLFGDAVLADESARGRILRGLAQTVKRTSPAVLDRYTAAMQAWSGSRSGDLAKLSVPTLVLVAEDDCLTRNGAEIAAALPNAKCETFAGCGHALAIEGADRVTERIHLHLNDATGTERTA